ncbi:MAG: methyltransferase domain-containing protein [Candidatus Eisenbacteria bacterium]|uniref:tRNA (guanine-N(7)-)-methyltransferase n=1 Tax=Eiseniibacteriota bacterium TaxID=2212470 RepID=A0A956RQ50_UNCEI|nr:methyltransferase domain-containing protein [Candidatus Eisenbacteria bacterium]
MKLSAPMAEVPFVLQPADFRPPLRLDEIFPVPGPCELEIGCGKGLYLEQAVRLEPGKNFLGVERAEKYFRHAVRRFWDDPPPNLRLVQTDAFDLLSRWLPAGSVCAVHVYFPDPWPKVRHAKRRLFQPQLYRLAHRVLRPEGILRIGSDVEPYFGTAVREIAQSGLFERTDWPDDAPDRLATNYAVKYAEQGRRLHYAKFRRAAADGLQG